MPESPGWRLVDFSTHIERWIAQDAPSIDLRVVVIDWLVSRADDPYQGVRRWPGADAWWHGEIPLTRTSDSRAVHVNYVIEERTHSVNRRGLATLDLPF